MKIAVIGWGSLIWNPGELSFKGDWRPADLHLPLEFSRISGGGRLTLVTDLVNGAHCEVSFIESGYDSLNDAVHNLRQRERTVLRHIGFVDIKNSTTSLMEHPNQPNVFDTIKGWCKTSEFNAAIWTALPSNFEEKTSKQYTADAAIDYLQSLEESEKEDAINYIRNAPTEINTPLRNMAISMGIL